jgi:hypothetical protein
VVQGDVAVVRRGAQLPSSQSGAAPLELSRPECGTVVGTIVPPDVRFAGEPVTREFRLGRQLVVHHQGQLTRGPSCEAGHMAAPDRAAASPISFLHQRGRPHMIGSTLAPHAVRDLPLPTTGEGAILGPTTTPNPGNFG